MSAVGLNTLNELAKADTREALSGILVRTGHALDFELINATLMTRDQSGRVSYERHGNTPPQWESACGDATSGARDPVLKRMSTSTRPVTYDKSTYIEANAADLWEEQAPFGYRTGVGIKIGLDVAQRVIFGMDRSAGLPTDEGDLLRLLGEVQLVAAYTSEALLRLTPRPVDPGQGFQFSKQELEILKWSAEGKSSWAIGQVLNMAETAVNRRFVAIRGKFGVATKTQAVARAIAQGLI